MGEIIPAREQSLELRRHVTNAQAQFVKELPKFLHSQADRMFAVILRALGDERIAKCTPRSVVEAVLESAQWGLIADGTHGALVAFKNSKANCHECQFIPMYRGMLMRVRESKLIGPISAELVFEGDQFKVTLGTQRRLLHVPNPDVDRTKFDNVTHAYSIAEWNSGKVDFIWMTRAELDRIRDKAPGRDQTWRTEPGEMMRKTAFRRHCKTLPMAANLAVLMDRDERREIGVPEPVAVQFETVVPAPRNELAETLEAVPETKPGPKAAPKAAPRAAPPRDDEPVQLRTVRGLTVDISQPFEVWAGQRLNVGSKRNDRNAALFERTCQEILEDPSEAVTKCLAAMHQVALETQERAGMAPRDPFQYAAVLVEMREARGKEPAPQPQH